MLNDLRYAIRQLRSSPGFALVAALSLALGIGANASIFSVANALLLRPLRPNASGGELVRIYRGHHSPLTYGELRDVSQFANAAFTDVVGERNIALARNDAAEPEKLIGALIAGNYFPALSVRAAHGRLFTGADSVGDAQSQVVIGYAYWRDHMGADAGVIGRVMRVNGHPFTIIGVAEEGFASSVVPWRPDVFFTSAASRALTGAEARTWGGSLYTTARLRSTIDRAQADAMLAVAARRIAASDTARYAQDELALRTDHVRGVNAEMRTPLAAGTGLLLVVVGLVLLIACANVANLLLARASTRGREVSMRLALGASRRRLIRQLLTESLVLATLGGALGLVATVWSTRLLATLIIARIPEPIGVDFAPDRTVVAFTALLCVATAIVFGLAPAIQTSRPALLASLKDGGGGAVGRRSRMRTMLVGGQVALCTVLIAIASLLAHSLANARGMSAGFEPRGLVDVAIDLGPRHLGDAGTGAFFTRVLDEARVVPGVQSATLAAIVPLAGSNMETELWLAGDKGGSSSAYFNVVGADYFGTLGIPIVRGRAIAADDRHGAPGVVVVNETFARRTWPDRDPIGERMSIEGPNGPWLAVIGVARDARYNTLGETTPPFMYIAHAQSQRDAMVLQVRTNPAGMSGVQRAMRGLVVRLDPLLPPPTVTTALDDMRVSMLPAQLGAALTAVFGGLALLLAAVGIYGVVAYAVARRTREIGVRSALGAGRVDLVRMLMLEAGRAVGVGLVVGLVLSLGAARVLASVLYDIGIVDPISVLATAVVLVSAAALAAYVPARRATRVSPVVALRAE